MDSQNEVIGKLYDSGMYVRGITESCGWTLDESGVSF
jgi:hypothetical protein